MSEESPKPPETPTPAAPIAIARCTRCGAVLPRDHSSVMPIAGGGGSRGHVTKEGMCGPLATHWSYWIVLQVVMPDGRNTIVGEPFASEGGPLVRVRDLLEIQEGVAARFRLETAGRMIVGGAEAQAFIIFIWPLGTGFLKETPPEGKPS